MCDTCDHGSGNGTPPRIWAGSLRRAVGGTRRFPHASLSHRSYAIQAPPVHRSPEVSSLPGAISLGVLRVCPARAGVQAGLDRLCPISYVTPRVAEPGLGSDRKGPPPPVRLVGLTKVELTIQRRRPKLRVLSTRRSSVKFCSAIVGSRCS